MLAILKLVLLALGVQKILLTLALKLVGMDLTSAFTNAMMEMFLMETDALQNAWLKRAGLV